MAGGATDCTEPAAGTPGVDTDQVSWPVIGQFDTILSYDWLKMTRGM